MPRGEEAILCSHGLINTYDFIAQLVELLNRNLKVSCLNLTGAKLCIPPDLTVAVINHS